MLRFSEDGSTFDVKIEETKKRKRRRKDGRTAYFCSLRGSSEGAKEVVQEITDSKPVTVVRDENSLEISYHHRLGQLKIPDEDVSKEHAEFAFHDGKFSVRDLGSLNGTKLNGRRISKERETSECQKIGAGDVLSFGKTEFLVNIYSRFITFEEEEENELNPLERQTKISVPRISNTERLQANLSTPERLLQGELERQEQRVRKILNNGVHASHEGAGESSDVDELTEVRRTAKEQLKELENPNSKTKRLRLKSMPFEKQEP